MKRIISLLLSIITISSFAIFNAVAENESETLDIKAKSYVLMDAQKE